MILIYVLFFQTNSWSDSSSDARDHSIWSRNYKPTIYTGPPARASDTSVTDTVFNPNSRSKKVVIKAPVIKSKVIKRARLGRSTSQFRFFQFFWSVLLFLVRSFKEREQ